MGERDAMYRKRLTGPLWARAGDTRKCLLSTVGSWLLNGSTTKKINRRSARSQDDRYERSRLSYVSPRYSALRSESSGRIGYSETLASPQTAVPFSKL